MPVLREPKTPKVVEAVGVASGRNTGFSKRLERAMSDAVIQAAKDGVTDPKKINALMLKAKKAAAVEG